MAQTDERRRSDAERSRNTRDRILEAAVDSLIEHGYAGTTVGAIQERAAVSRGALLHQYPNKAYLLVDAIRHLSDRQLAQLHADPQPQHHADDWLATLWDSFATPLFGALLELWVAARTDPELRRALLIHQRELHRCLRNNAVRQRSGADDERFDTVFEMTLAFYRGLALTGILSTSRAGQLHAAWRGAVDSMLQGSG